MTKKIIIVFFAITIPLALVLFATPAYQTLMQFTPYYQTCMKVKIGMTKDEALTIMKPYTKYYGKDSYWPYTGETESLFDSNNGNKCRIFTKDGKVTNTAFEVD